MLRRLYQGREKQVSSIGITASTSKIQTGIIDETIIAAFPRHRNWMRWKLRVFEIWLREKVFNGLTMSMVRKAARAKPYDIIHLIHHGPYSTALFTPEFLRGKQLWVSFHDHYSTTHTTFESTDAFWKKANRRLVISEEMGQEYQRLFGDFDYEIITDGITSEEIKAPREINKAEPVIIYFSGLLHLGYYPLFRTLADALDVLTRQAISFKLVLRGTQELDFLNNRLFAIEYRAGFISDDAIKQELDAASILYLPIKFSDADFYLYSLSTKMVSYLGAPGSILYHGPLDSAACRLMERSGAAVCCGSLNADDLVKDLQTLLEGRSEVSANAKLLAKTDFNLTGIQERFWEVQHS